MTTLQILLLLLLGIVLVGVSIVLRVRSAGRYEIKPTDLVFIVVPLLLAGIATGKLTGLDMFGVKADLSTLWAQVADTRIEGQVTSAPDSSLEDVMQMATTASKGGVGDIPRLIEQRTNVLTFNLGTSSYYGPAIAEYFEQLYGSAYLEFIVINKADGAFFGMYAAEDLAPYFRIRGTDGYAAFADSLNQADESELARLPGFIPAEQALEVTTSKREALRAMADANRESLPVVDDDGSFVGTVDRAKLTTSLVLAVTEGIPEEATR